MSRRGRQTGRKHTKSFSAPHWWDVPPPLTVLPLQPARRPRSERPTASSVGLDAGRQGSYTSRWGTVRNLPGTRPSHQSEYLCPPVASELTPDYVPQKNPPTRGRRQPAAGAAWPCPQWPTVHLLGKMTSIRVSPHSAHTPRVDLATQLLAESTPATPIMGESCR